MDRHKYIQAKWTVIFLLLVTSIAMSQMNKTNISFEEYLRSNIPSKTEIDVFLNKSSWAQFDPDVGYILGNYIPPDGMDSSSTISTPQSLYKMTDPDWMVYNLKDDLALQMALYARKKIKDIDTQKIKELSNHLNFDLDLQNQEIARKSVSILLDKYSFAATKYILKKVKEFTENNNKKLMIIIFDPDHVTKELIEKRRRYDEEIVDYLKRNNFNYFDMNLVHVEDYKNFNLSLKDYFK